MANKELKGSAKNLDAIVNEFGCQDELSHLMNDKRALALLDAFKSNNDTPPLGIVFITGTGGDMNEDIATSLQNHYFKSSPKS